MVGASLKKKDTMKLITQFEAATRTTAELQGLYRMAFNALAAAPRGSQERRDAQESVENIQHELAMRKLAP